MVRVKGGVTSRRRHKRQLKTTKGYRGLGSRIYTQAKQKSMLAGEHAYRDRKNKKRTFRSLWIVRLSAALRAMGWKYGEFSGALTKKGLLLNRRVLSEMAKDHPAAFEAVVEHVKK